MNFVIVGGGPIGLYSSIMFKKYFKNATVTVYEKRMDYSRNQILYIDKKVARHFPRKLYHDIWGEDKPGCYIGFTSRTQDANCNIRKSGLSVIIRILENSMKKLAMELGVNIINREITEADVKQLSNSADYIIGCDGTNSVLDKFIKSKMLFGKESLGMGVVFNYEDAKIKKDYIKYPQNRFRAFKSNTHPSLGYIGINIDKNEPDEELDKTIQTAFKFYGFKNTSNVRTWKFRITPYQKSKVTGQLNKSKLILIGDSAVGVHFFSGTGVNNGFNSVNLLCNLLKNGKNLSEYRRYISKLGKINIVNNNKLVIDFDNIAGKCRKLPDDKLYAIARKQKIENPEIIPRKELCLMISYNVSQK